MRQSILKAFGLSEAEPVHFDQEDTNSRTNESLDVELDANAPLTSTTIPEIPQIVVTKREATNVLEPDENHLSTSSENARAPTNTFRERARITGTNALTPEDIYSSAVRIFLLLFLMFKIVK
jgi:hypothetical protein